MLDKSKVKLFEIDDCDWVAAETEEQAIEWYSKQVGVSKEELEIIEVSLETTFLQPADEMTSVEEAQNFEKKTIGEEFFVKIPFSFTLQQLNEIPEPFIAGSTEY